MKAFVAALIMCMALCADSQSLSPRKGSYLFYGQPVIEDNSMLIEEAFNQEAGNIQHISNFIYGKNMFWYSYSQEIPLADIHHQVSFSIAYGFQKKPRQNNAISSNGLGDLCISYRPMVMGKNAWILVIPRISLIVPSGNSRAGLGTGGWGGQVQLAMTKRLSRSITTHFNAGYTLITKADHFTYTDDGILMDQFERNLPSANIGSSVVWQVHPRINLLAEYVTTAGNNLENNHSLRRENVSVVNPGFRCSFTIANVQFVPGASVPLNFRNGFFNGVGAFVYLSIEVSH